MSIALAAIKMSQLLDNWDAAIDRFMTSKLSYGSMIEAGLLMFNDRLDKSNIFALIVEIYG